MIVVDIIRNIIQGIVRDLIVGESTPPGNWILEDGTWNDNNFWIDSDIWNDGP